MSRGLELYRKSIEEMKRTLDSQETTLGSEASFGAGFRGYQSLPESLKSEIHEAMATGDTRGIVWGPKGSALNKEIMRYIAAHYPRVGRAMRVQKRLQMNFPYRDYGTEHHRRGTEEGLAKYGPSWQEADEEQRKNRNEFGWYGPGMYSNTGYGAHGHGALWGKMLGGMAGRALGGRFGHSRMGGSLGAYAGDKISDIVEHKVRGLLGMGDYQGAILDQTDGILGNHSGNLRMLNGAHTEVNQLINKSEPSVAIVTHRDETNSITIVHSEYIGDVSPAASSSFQTLYFIAINPGLAGTFPWLSNLAQFYEEYEFSQLAFTFKSMVTEGNANASGTVVMATQYNPTNAAFPNKQTMENYDYANSGKVTADIHHGIECDPTKRGGSPVEYVRTGSIPSNQDLKTYDLATFQLAVNGAYPTASITLGELWVNYKVTLRKTKIPPTGSVSKLNATALQVTSTTATAAALLGSNWVTNISNPSTGFTITGTTITLPTQCLSGNYVFSIQYTGVTVQPTAALSVSYNGLLAAPTVYSSTTSAATSNLNVLAGFSFTIANTTGNATYITLSGFTSLVAANVTFALYQVYSAT